MSSFLSCASLQILHHFTSDSPGQARPALTPLAMLVVRVRGAAHVPAMLQLPASHP